MAGDAQSRGIFHKAHRFFFGLGILWAVFIALLATPFVQRHATFKHALSFPFFANFSSPEKYGLAPGKTLNFQLTTSDNETLGAWFVLSDPVYQALPEEPFRSQPNETVSYALSHAPTVLFLHGAAGTRAVPFRVQTYLALSSKLSCNILAIDYRGFGDSTGIPDQDGLVEDSYTAWNWLLDHGAKSEDILIFGHSLGTGVSAQLVKKLAEEYNATGDVKAKPRGVVLSAPFSSAVTLAETFALFGLPILQPIQSFPLGLKLMRKILYTELNTLAVISHFHIPTLITHSRLDETVPYSHSQTLVDELLTPLLPPAVPLPAPGSPLLKEEFAAFTQAQTARREARLAVVKKREVPNFGIVEEFDRDGPNGNGAHKVVYVESLWASHSNIDLHEGVQDEIARVFKLGVHAT